MSLTIILCETIFNGIAVRLCFTGLTECRAWPKSLIDGVTGKVGTSTQLPDKMTCK